MRAIALIMTLSAPGLMAATAPTDPAPFESGTFESTRLGTVHVFGSAPSTQIAIILSGDGGWKPAEASGRTAAALAGRDVLALGIDVNRITKLMAVGGKAPFDLGSALAEVMDQARVRYGVTGPATLAGYSAGATLAYAAFVQGPTGRFQGLITEGFCPDQITVRPVGDAAGHTLGVRRSGVGGWVYGPADLPGSWALIEGAKEHSCPGGDVSQFVAATPRARLWSVARVSHAFAPSGRWASALQAAISWVGLP